MRSDPLTGPAHVDSFVLIQNTPATDQFITGGLSLTNSGDGTVAVTTPGNQTITAFSGGVSLATSSPIPGTIVTTGSAAVTAGGNQFIRAQFVDVGTGDSTTGNASLAATGNQWIHTTSGTSSFSGNSMRVAALGSGTASVTAGASQLLELDYPEQMQGGAGGTLMVGDVNALGISRVKAADQNIFARSITVQSGGNNTISELKATNTQTITTLQGAINVFGGSGDNSLAQIDPVTQMILVNGPVEIMGGSGINAIAQILNGTGTQTIIATNGNITLTGGTGAGADALITSLGTQTIGSTGAITLAPVVGGGNAGISPLGNPPPGCAPCLVTNVATSSSTVSNFATTPVLTTEAALDETLVEITPAAAATEEPILGRAPVCR